MAIGRLHNAAGLASTASLVLAAAFFGAAHAHDHHGGETAIPEGETVTKEPLVRTTRSRHDAPE